MKTTQELLDSAYNKCLQEYNEEYRGYKFKCDNRNFLLLHFDHHIEFDSYDNLIKFIDKILDSVHSLC